MKTQGSEPKREREGGRVVIALLAGLVVLLGGAYAAAYVVAGDKVPRGTSVAGVDIGGSRQAEAAAALEAGLADRVATPIAVEVDGTTTRVAAEDAGLSVDYLASVADAGGERSWDPTRLWDYFTGGEDLDPVVEVDQDRLTRAVEDLGAEVGSEPVDGAVEFVDGRVEVTEAQAGEAIDPDEARTELLGAWLSDGRTAELTLAPSQPEIDASDVREAVEGFANPALSAPVTLLFGTSPVTLQVRDYADVLRLRPEDGELVPAVRVKRLAKLVDAGIAEGDPEDATVALVNGRPKVVPAKPGVTYEPADVAAAFTDLVTRPDGQRQVEVPSTVAEPEFTTEDARALRIRRQVSSFTTYFPYAEYRNTNIGRAAELVTGTVLKPGETFSMNDIVGERTAENGFVDGFIISNGIFKEDLGGGVSQMATTLFNAMFFAGLEDVEHKPHSFYIDRYPVGREATVAFGAIDLRFRNDTPYGVLVDARVTPSTPSSQGEVTVTMYSTKVWDITTATGDRYNFTPPATRTLYTEDCYPNTGYGGFEIDVKRFFSRPGSGTVERTQNFNTVYTPSDTVICRPPGSEPDPAAAADAG